MPDAHNASAVLRYALTGILMCDRIRLRGAMLIEERAPGHALARAEGPVRRPSDSLRMQGGGGIAICRK